MQPTIKFSHNWNMKLKNFVFTTIRTDKHRQYYLDNLNKRFHVLLNETIYCKAKLIKVDSRKFKECDTYLTLLDTGIIDLPARYDIFKRFGITLETNVIVLTFNKK